MNLDFFEILGFIGDVLNAFGGGSKSSDLDYIEKPKVKKKTKYLTEKVSTAFILISTVLLLFVFKDPLPSENYVQTIVVASLIGLAISLLFFFLLYVLELYYFKNLFKLLLFSFSSIFLSVSIVFCVYFKSGIFI